MKPTAINMTSRTETRDVICLGIFRRVDAQACQKVEERRWKDAATSSHEVPATVAVAALSTTLLNARIRQLRGFAVALELPLS